MGNHEELGSMRSQEGARTHFTIFLRIHADLFFLFWKSEQAASKVNPAKYL